MRALTISALQLRSGIKPKGLTRGEWKKEEKTARLCGGVWTADNRKLPGYLC